MWITAHIVNTFIEVRDKTFFTPWKEASGEILNTSETLTRHQTHADVKDQISCFFRVNNSIWVYY